MSPKFDGSRPHIFTVRTALLFDDVQTQCFITAMDALKLEQRAVDEVQPLIYDLSDRLNKVRKTDPSQRREGGGAGRGEAHVF